MEKTRVIKNLGCQDERTKPKLMGYKQKANQKQTVSTRIKQYNQLASKLISQSATISQQSGVNPSSSDSDSVVEVDPLCVNGTISNLAEFDEYTKQKYSYSNGLCFHVADYLVVFPGRHQVNFVNGLPVCLYIPPKYKLKKDLISGKQQIVIQRKIKNQLKDPMQYPYIIINPNNSIYPTYICSWIECKRKITLQHYIEYEQQTNQYLIFGNAIHRYLEWLIRKQAQPREPTETQMRKLYNSFLYDMYLTDIGFDMFVERVQNGICNLVAWYNTYAIEGKLIQLNKWEKKYLKIMRVLGSQVMVKSAYFGIRGKVDGLFQGQYIDQKANIQYKVVVPFQLKTGLKVMDSHKKQLQFYNLLFRQSTKTPTIGLLYYSDSNHLEYRMQNPLICFENINCHRNRIMINIVNLYSSQGENIILPGLPDTFDQCKFCDVSLECSVNRSQPIKDLEDISEEVPEKYNHDIRQRFKKLSILQINYLKRWTQLLHIQQCYQKKQNQQNKNKNYFNKIRLYKQQMKKLRDYMQGQSLRLILQKNIQSQQMSDQIQSYFKVGERLRIFVPTIRLSDTCRIFNISKKSAKTIIIEVQFKNSNIKFNKNKCGMLMELDDTEHFQVDLQKYDNSMYNYTRGYCYRFVVNAKQWTKNIVINQNYEPINSKKLLDQQIIETKSLNSDQAQAFRKCVQAERFFLVQGMPGTGKTQLILKLIQYFYKQNKNILVSSFTNQALSNILEREINEEKIIPADKIIREGSRFGISKEFDYLSSQSQSHQSIESYKQYFSSKKVWFVTLSSLYLPHLPKNFDVVIVDQASQCLQASCLQALLKADKFILIGDQKQLQPVIKSPKAIEKGMQISLFQRLCKLYPSMKTSLKIQYRMSPAIMNLTNNLVYEGKLQLGCQSMQSRILKLAQNWQQIVPKYLHPVFDPYKALRFVNYDNVLNLFSKDQRNGGNIDIKRINRLLQIRIACMIYKYYRGLGIQRQKILIISAYNSIVHQLFSTLRSQNLQISSSDIMTIDKSQGSDKQIIIFIFHTGNKQLIQNYRRLNVALTRAKNKFIIVGSYKELSEMAVWTGKLAKLLLPDMIDVGGEFLEGVLHSHTNQNFIYKGTQNQQVIQID